MNEDQFNAMLAIIVPPIIEQVTTNSNVDDEKAISRLYQDELLTGSYDYPEEA